MNILKRIASLSAVALGLTLLLVPNQVAFATPEPEEYALMDDLGPQQFGQFALDTTHADQAMLSGHYDQAFGHLNAARDHLLSVSRQIAAGQSLETWDNVREAEADLLLAYADLGRLYHQSGQYNQALNVIKTAVMLHPTHQELYKQKLFAYVMHSE